MDRAIRVAFVKFVGLASGGTENFLQSVAINLPRDKFLVDYYYCDTARYVGSDYVYPDTDPVRLKYMQDHKVNLIKFHVEAKDITMPTHDWVNTDFWDIFKEDQYDVVVTGRAGHREYPFYLIKKIPIVDTLHLTGGADNQKNIKKVIHLSRWHANKWIKIGGDRRRIEIVPQPLSIMPYEKVDYRDKYGLIGKFIYGFHQRDDDSIFSPIPLNAYAKIENSNNHFVLLNGSSKYKEQAKKLGINNITFLPFAKTMDEVYNFLEMLDVYAHGRRDGETSGAAIAEGMAFGLPVISHRTNYNNGHIETIGNAGKVVKTANQYAQEMQKLESYQDYYDSVAKIAKQRFIDRYSFDRQIKKIENIITEAVTSDIKYSPYHWTVLLGYVYQVKFAIRCWLARNIRRICKSIGINI